MSEPSPAPGRNGWRLGDRLPWCRLKTFGAIVAVAAAAVAPAPPPGGAGVARPADAPRPVERGETHGAPATNAACHVCHANYDGESLATDHLREGVGCVRCHGESLAHVQDEENLTPPERMYAAGDVDRMCAGCHEGHDVPARAVLRRWRSRCPQKTDPAQVVCTDCHGNHRLARRSVRWDRKTGKLLP